MSRASVLAGIGAMDLLARRTGLIGDIDRNLHLFNGIVAIHESDHVLNIAYKILAGGKRIEHLELRNDEVSISTPRAGRADPLNPHHRRGFLPPLLRA